MNDIEAMLGDVAGDLQAISLRWEAWSHEADPKNPALTDECRLAQLFDEASVAVDNAFRALALFERGLPF